MWPTPNWRENFRHDRTNTITFLIFDSLILLMESKITGVFPPHPGGGGADYIILLGFIEFWCLLKILKFFHRFYCQTYIYIYTLELFGPNRCEIPSCWISSSSQASLHHSNLQRSFELLILSSQLCHPSSPNTSENLMNLCPASSDKVLKQRWKRTGLGTEHPTVTAIH